MKFPHLNATPEKLERWIDGPVEGFKIRLRLITRVDLEAVPVPMRAKAKYIAERFFLGFDGKALDANGVEVEDSVANRTEMLFDRDFGLFVERKLLDHAIWLEEGKDDSGSGS